MKTFAHISTILSALMLSTGALFAQTSSEQDAQAAAGAAGCAACGGTIIFLIVACIAINVAILVWVARDAKSRGMDSSALWMLLVMFTGFIGLIIYIFSRPQGNLIQCPHCKNKRLQVSAKCPHCGNV